MIQVKLKFCVFHLPLSLQLMLPIFLMDGGFEISCHGSYLVPNQDCLSNGWFFYNKETQLRLSQKYFIQIKSKGKKPYLL